ncbi:GRIP and coiled-coil domain-containing protein 1 isoform X2 [Anopheles funestus]|uniref:GRIP and coiled-coil domain-containing protein 1 isoform X2 n=1 Tax=Anopheles funestus TaxID=62324 RepID=UPI0020C73E53|nr:GRIP and coiled-coil domain-containing protein 1 isoform X2 [Anopheles funestus]
MWHIQYWGYVGLIVRYTYVIYVICGTKRFEPLSGTFEENISIIMEKRNHEMHRLKEYESIISSQKEHINRYESRLKDIIVAYKGLAKEKAALEQSLQTLSTEGDDGAGKVSFSLKNNEQSDAKLLVPSAPIEGQVQKLMQNLATLTAERNRIEEVLKSDRNQLRQQLANKDATIEELTRRIRILENQSQPDTSASFDSGIAERLPNGGKYEDQSLKIRELKKLLDDERNLNEQLELQLGNLKTQFLLTIPDRQAEQKKRAEEKNHSSMHSNIEKSSNNSMNLKESLQDLQREMNNLKKQYAIAVSDEKQRVCLAEESSKRLREIHEERVANFESRIRELSEMVGKYDRLKEQDKAHILQLKNTIAHLKTKYVEEQNSLPCDNFDRESIEDGYGTRQELFELHLAESSDKTDLNFPSNVVVHDQHLDAQNELENYKWRYEQAMGENQRLKKELLLCQECVAQLKQKLDSQKQSTAQLESKLQQKLADQQMAFKNESAKHSDALHAMQASFERQIGHLQDSLQKQRERSLAVMDEKDEEIKTLRTSLEIISLSSSSIRQQDSSSDAMNNVKEDRINRWNSSHDSSPMLTSFTSSVDEHQHILHYAQEIARKDVEISSLRTSKNMSEVTLRKLAQEKIMIEERYKEQIAHMERDIERLRNNNQLEGSNLEYLKNVVLSFLLTRDIDSKKHMTNAIAAVLKFDTNEIQAVNNIKH